MNIDKNSFVTIDYLINLGEAETYPPDGKPEEISFCMGWGAMPPGLEEALIGMKVNEAKVINLSAEQAYGELDEELLMEVPRSDFGSEVGLRPGLVFETENEDGDQRQEHNDPEYTAGDQFFDAQHTRADGL